jgi:hypothetical protein
VEEKLLILQENLSSLPVLVEFVMLSLYYSDKCFVNHCLYVVGLCFVVIEFKDLDKENQIYKQDRS